jgi:hypothetical protein
MKGLRRVVLHCESLEERVVLDDNSAGPNGIDARNLNLTGRNIHIGQVETGRPGFTTWNTSSSGCQLGGLSGRFGFNRPITSPPTMPSPGMA